MKWWVFRSLNFETIFFFGYQSCSPNPFHWTLEGWARRIFPSLKMVKKTYRIGSQEMNDIFTSRFTSKRFPRKVKKKGGICFFNYLESTLVYIFEIFCELWTTFFWHVMSTHMEPWLFFLATEITAFSWVWIQYFTPVMNIWYFHRAEWWRNRCDKWKTLMNGFLSDACSPNGLLERLKGPSTGWW